jgi:hypothetical protein
MIRTLRNDFTDEMERLEAGGAALDERRSVFAASTLKDAALDGDLARGKLEAGQSAGAGRRHPSGGRIGQADRARVRGCYRPAARCPMIGLQSD